MMAPKLTQFLFVAVVVCLMATTIATPASGNFSNCGDIAFNFTWSPEPISPSKPLKVHLDYQFPHALDGGFYDITIWFYGDPDPFMEFADSFTCDDVSRYVSCPINKGFKVSMTKTFEHIPNIGSYPGDYSVKLNVQNKNHEQMICLKGHIQILKS